MKGLCRSVSMGCGALFVREGLGIELQKCYVPSLDIREGVSEVWACSIYMSGKD